MHQQRSLLSTGMLEVLQVLKERLDFTSYWIANEDYSIERATGAAINEILSSAKCDELLYLRIVSVS